MADLNQTLPTSYPDLRQLNERAPMWAAMLAGQQAQTAQQNNSALQRAFQAQEEYKQKERPLTLEDLAAQTKERLATGYYNTQAGNKLGLANEITAQTMPETISATRAEQGQKKTEAELAQMVGRAQKYGQLAVSTQRLPAHLRPAEVLNTFPELKNNPEILQHLVDNAETIPQEFGRAAFDSYQQLNTTRAAREQQASHERVATIGGEASVKGQEIAATSRERVAAEATQRAIITTHDKLLAGYTTRAGALSTELAQLMRQNPKDPRIPAIQKEIEQNRNFAFAIEQAKVMAADPSNVNMAGVAPQFAITPRQAPQVDTAPAAGVSPTGTAPSPKVPQPGEATPDAYKGWSLLQWKSKYPGVPEDQLKARVKEIYGKEPE